MTYYVMYPLTTYGMADAIPTYYFLEVKYMPIINLLTGKRIAEQIVYVDSTNGVDTNSGDKLHPVNTIKAALNLIKASGIIKLSAGTHKVSTSDFKNPLGRDTAIYTMNKHITIVGKGLETTLLANIVYTSGYNPSVLSSNGGSCAIVNLKFTMDMTRAVYDVGIISDYKSSDEPRVIMENILLHNLSDTAIGFTINSRVDIQKSIIMGKFKKHALENDYSSNVTIANCTHSIKEGLDKLMKQSTILSTEYVETITENMISKAISNYCFLIKANGYHFDYVDGKLNAIILDEFYEKGSNIYNLTTVVENILPLLLDNAFSLLSKVKSTYEIEE